MTSNDPQEAKPGVAPTRQQSQISDSTSPHGLPKLSNNKSFLQKAAFPEIDPEKTYASRLTARETSALASLVVFGPNAETVVRSLVFPDDQNRWRTPTHKRLLYLRLGKTVLDDVVIQVEENTGDIYIHGHGGIELSDSLLRDLASEGANLTSWTSWAQRREGPIRAEARLLLSQTEGLACTRVLLDQYEGALEKAILEFESSREEKILDELLRFSDFGLHLAVPWRVLFVGKANVGKSSLLNKILGFERAITSNLPGTTRDLLAGQRLIAGWPMEFLDGAGFHAKANQLENIGQDILTQERKKCDLCLQVIDLSVGIDSVDEEVTTRLQPDFKIGTKSDLVTTMPARAHELDFLVSSKTGSGVDPLLQGIVAKLIPVAPDPGTAVPFTPRQIAEIQRLKSQF